MTLPEDIRAAAHLEEGDILEIEMLPEGLLIRPHKLIDATQAWFWSPEWQKGEQEADADLAAGRLESAPSGEEFVAALRKRPLKRSSRQR